MLTETRVGPLTATDGSINPGRSVKTGDLCTTDAHGRYHEAVSRGRCFFAAIPGASPVALGTALGTGLTTLTLYNPSQSGIIMSVLEVTVGITTDLSSAATASAIYTLAANVNPFAAAPTGLTSATIRNCLLGAAAGIGQAYTAATVPVNPSVVRMVGSTLMTTVTAANTSKTLYSMVDCVDGKLALSPNTALTFQGIGTTTSGVITMMWEEIPTF